MQHTIHEHRQSMLSVHSELGGQQHT